MVVRLSSKGQLVIPKSIRDALRLKTGAHFDAYLQEGKIILEPVETSAVDALYGKYADIDFLAGLEAEHRREVRNEATIRA